MAIAVEFSYFDEYYYKPRELCYTFSCNTAICCLVLKFGGKMILSLLPIPLPIISLYSSVLPVSYEPDSKPHHPRQLHFAFTVNETNSSDRMFQIEIVDAAPEWESSRPS